MDEKKNSIGSLNSRITEAKDRTRKIEDDRQKEFKEKQELKRALDRIRIISDEHGGVTQDS